MERTVPSTASEEIELYERTIYSLLRSTTDIQIRTLEEVHGGMHSLLHINARQPRIDINAFTYAWLRLPACMPNVDLIIMGQSEETFRSHGYAKINQWEKVAAPARRRRCYFNAERRTLAAFIASRSDIDDLVPSLVAFQIEWNKLHTLLINIPDLFLNQPVVDDPIVFEKIAEMLDMPVSDLGRLKTIWGTEFLSNLKMIAQRRMNLRLNLLNGSLTEYWRATRSWWSAIEAKCLPLRESPVYFISSNPHSICNLVTGYALKKQQELISFLKEHNSELYEEWEKITDNSVQINTENFFYYALKKVQQTTQGEKWIVEQDALEKEMGIIRVPSLHSFDVEAQIIKLSSLKSENLDPRLRINGLDFLEKSDAIIINIDYPLGMAAFNILRVIAESTGSFLGAYIMGKAATLNGVRGDVMIPNVVQDEHSLNTYLFKNAFKARDVSPYLSYGTVLDNQKAVSVLGTFLQNSRIMDVIYREGYTDIEMEAGPYLSAIYEMCRPTRHPSNEIVNLYEIPFDLGILHYASDTPLSKGQNLGAGTLSYQGMDPTYGSAIAILRRIFSLEKARLEER